MSARVVALVPAYNASATLAEAVLSLLPTREPLDILVVDDGSREPVTDLVARDPRLAALGEQLIVLRLEPNRGLISALNAGVAWILARPYEYVLRMDADDLSRPGRVDAQVAFMDAHPEVGLCGTGLQTFTQVPGKGMPGARPALGAGIRRKMAYNSAVSHPCWIVRAEAFRKVGGYDPAYPHAEDYDWSWRCIRQYAAANLPEVHVDYRISAGQISSRHRLAQIHSRMRVQLRELGRGELRCALGLVTSAVSILIPSPVRIWLRRFGI